MPIPSTLPEFLELVRKSTLVEPAALDDFLRRSVVAAAADTPEDLAAVLVRDGLLTSFQAELLLQGRWRGFNLGRYKVLQPIGAGGMGQVYLCEHLFMRRRVALKVLPAERARNAADLERFYREARAVAALDHPNIVRAYDMDREGPLHFLAMEYVDGLSLQQVITQQGPLSPRRAAQYLRQAALGLHHAFSAKLVHRDIKPANLLVDRSGIVKLLDLGLARFFEDADDLSARNDETILGTADYIAPEQTSNSHEVDTRADIYSLGATFYFCLTGQPPFPGGSVAQKMMGHYAKKPKSIRSYRNDVPDDLIAIIEKMMAKDPDKRYQVPADVALAVASLPLLGGDVVSLDTVIVSGDGTFKEGSHKGRGDAVRLRWWLRLAGAGLACGVTVLWYLLWRMVRGK